MVGKVTAFVALALCVSVCSPDTQAQLMCETTNKPAEVRFIYDDLEHFIRALELMDSSKDSAAILQKEYIAKASPGLKEFLRENGVDTADYLGVMRKRPDTYHSLIGFPSFLRSNEDSIRLELKRLQKIIPGATFLPVYYLVGFFGGLHAEPSGYGLLLAFANPHKRPKDLAATVVHETVHVQQAMAVGIEEYHSIYDTKKSLLAFAIREGIARFLTELSTGQISNREAHDYYLEHEIELIAKFKKEMNDSLPGDWMWAKPKNPDQPQQVGYVLGSMIVRAYYENAEDKSRAIQEMLSVTDYPAFFEKSKFSK